MSYGPGWRAIDSAWAHVYSGRTPLLFRSLIDVHTHADPCKQVVAWPADESWHLVGYGLTELFQKESFIVDQDGWGYEITLRVPRKAEDDSPPKWAVDAVRTLTRFVECTQESLDEGDWIQFDDGFIPDTNLVAAVFADDPAFPNGVEGPFGRFVFRQAVGITAVERDWRQANGTGELLKLLSKQNPLLCTRPGRSSVVGAGRAITPRPVSSVASE